MAAAQKSLEQRFHDFARSIRIDGGMWPTERKDWAPLEAMMAEGLDVAHALPAPYKTTFLHRLLKQSRKPSGKTDEERVRPILLLAQLTDGRATQAKFSEAWLSLAISWHAARTDPGFMESMIGAFLWGKPETNEATATRAEKLVWGVFMNTAINMDRPDLLDELLRRAPAGVDFLTGICGGGERMTHWLVDRMGEDLLANTPRPELTGSESEGGLLDYIRARTTTSPGTLGKQVTAWADTARREKELDERVPHPQAPGRDEEAGRRGPRL